MRTSKAARRDSTFLPYLGFVHTAQDTVGDDEAFSARVHLSSYPWPATRPSRLNA